MYIARDILPSDLYVVTSIFNPPRFKSRWTHYRRFAKYVVDSGAKLITVEVAYGDRAWALTEWAPHGDGHQYIKLRTNHELWLKENALNIGIAHVPRAAQYIAWVDADVIFARHNWALETLHQLQHWPMVQMWSDAVDLGPLYMPIQWHLSFMWCYHHGMTPPKSFETSGGYIRRQKVAEVMPKNKWHPGFAWAARREALDAIGGLIDFGVLGAGDNHLCRALIGKVEDSVHPKIHARYRERLIDVQWKAEQSIRRKVGYVSGLLMHYWHGRKSARNYYQRWSILVDQQFNPDTDIHYDTQGVLQLVDRHDDRTRVLRDRLMRYARARNEDSIDLEGIGQSEWTLDAPTQ